MASKESILIPLGPDLQTKDKITVTDIDIAKRKEKFKGKFIFSCALNKL